MDRQPPQPSSYEQQPDGQSQWRQQTPPRQPFGQQFGQPSFGQFAQQPPAPSQPLYGQPQWGQQAPPQQPSGQPGQQSFGQPPFGQPGQQPGASSQSFYGMASFGNPPQQVPFGQQSFGQPGQQLSSQPPTSGRNSTLLEQPSPWPMSQPGQFLPPPSPPGAPQRTGKRGPQPGRKTGVMIILAACVLLVVLLGGYGAITIVRSGHGSSPQTNATPTQPAVQVTPTATTALAPTATPTLQPTPEPTPKPTLAPTPTPRSVTKSISILGSYPDFSFSPKTLTIPVGTTVIWTNKSDTPHTVTSSNGNTLNSGNMAPGATFIFKFTKPGTYRYYCIYHPGMVGTIIVT